MSKRKRNESSRDEANFVAKKNGKFNIFAFILCLLIAVVIWLYASNLDNKNKQEAMDSVDRTEVSVEESSNG